MVRLSGLSSSAATLIVGLKVSYTHGLVGGKLGAPYVSAKRLAENSLSALLGAVEIYNKPMMSYRDEVTVMLVVNAWELALKAALRQNGGSIFYPKKRGEEYKSISLDDCLRRVDSRKLWPDGVDGPGVTANIKALAEFRNRAIHLYNTQGLGAVIHPFLQQNVLNYRDFMLARFKKDLADSMTWQLLPLGATAPAEAVRFMRTDSGATTAVEVRHFVDALRTIMDEAEAAGGEMSRVATLYDINMQSVKKMSSADIVVAIDPEGEGQIVERKTDPNQTHPYTMTTLLLAANKKRKGRELTSYDFQAMSWKNAFRDDAKYAWTHSKATGVGTLWSGAMLHHITKMGDGDYDKARIEYRAHLKLQASK